MLEISKHIAHQLLLSNITSISADFFLDPSGHENAAMSTCAQIQCTRCDVVATHAGFLEGGCDTYCGVVR
jgi:hypothetical protein